MSEILLHIPRRATENEILEAFAARLSEIPGVNKGVCVVSDQPIPIMMPHGKIAFSVSMGDTEFDEGMQRGGSFSNLNCQSSVVVGVFLQNMADRAGRAEVVAKNFSHWCFLVIGYLLKQDPSRERGQAWEPSIEGRGLLSSQLVVRSLGSIRDVPGHETWFGRELSFGIEYVPDLRNLNEPI